VAVAVEEDPPAQVSAPRLRRVQERRVLRVRDAVDAQVEGGQLKLELRLLVVEGFGVIVP
jgi:hypothetical protein